MWDVQLKKNSKTLAICVVSFRMESRRRLMLVGEDAEEGEEDQSDRHNSSEDSHAFRSDSIPHHYVTLSLENGRPVEMVSVWNRQRL